MAKVRADSLAAVCDGFWGIVVVVFFVIACVGSLAIAGGGSCLTGRGAFFAASGSRFSVIALTGSSGVPCVDFCVIT